MMSADAARVKPRWTPHPDAWSRTRIGKFAHRRASECVGDYDALWKWSVADLERFWQAIWDEFDIHSVTPRGVALASAAMPGAQWYPLAQVSYPGHILRAAGANPDSPAIIEESEARSPVEISWAALAQQVGACALGMRGLGVVRGDRVAALLPNIHETVVAFLAAASIGAIWTSCAPEFGVAAVVERWSQVHPKVLLAINGYRHRGEPISKAGEIAHILERVPSIESVVGVHYLPELDALNATLTWESLLAERDGGFEPEMVAFDHPLYILYSSGTTGLPKPIVHGHGGILLEHCKALGLHLDLHPGDRFFWYSTTGWMMWNYLVSGLLLGATVVLYDGHPGYPTSGRLWELAARRRLTHFGVSAAFLATCERRPPDLRGLDLSSVKFVGSTGSPLVPAAQRWAQEAFGPGVQIASTSGGTDVCSGFVGSAPVVPVWEGRISCRHLGCDVSAFDDSGTSLVGVTGELVVTQPMPSMPVGLWGDSDHERYRATYFDRYPGVWRHGDWVTIFDDGSCEITGRSDATLNRGGVRFGTAELYSVVEALAAVADSLAVHLEALDGGPGTLIVFVVVDRALAQDSDIAELVCEAIRDQLSPRHVPDSVVVVRALPRTLTGKKLEVPVKRILQGLPVERAVSIDSLEPGTSLDPILEVARTLGFGKA